jgi:Transposase DDE domain
MGFYYGVKLQLITDIDGLPLDLQFTTTRLGDRDWLESKASTIFKNQGYLFVGDKGYQGKEFQERIRNTGNYLFTGIKQSKTNKLPLAQWQLRLLKLRSRIETCFGKLKNNYNLVSTKARSPLGYMLNWILAIFSFVVGWN